MTPPAAKKFGSRGCNKVETSPQMHRRYLSTSEAVPAYGDSAGLGFPSHRAASMGWFGERQRPAGFRLLRQDIQSIVGDTHAVPIGGFVWYATVMKPSETVAPASSFV